MIRVWLIPFSTNVERPREPSRRAELDVFIDWFNRVWKAAPNAIAAALERNARAPSPIDAREMRAALGTVDSHPRAL